MDGEDSRWLCTREEGIKGKQSLFSEENLIQHTLKGRGLHAQDRILVQLTEEELDVASCSLGRGRINREIQALCRAGRDCRQVCR